VVGLGLMKGALLALTEALLIQLFKVVQAQPWGA